MNYPTVWRVVYVSNFSKKIRPTESPTTILSDPTKAQHWAGTSQVKPAITVPLSRSHTFSVWSAVFPFRSVSNSVPLSHQRR